jgi:hypothetical protein
MTFLTVSGKIKFMFQTTNQMGYSWGKNCFNGVLKRSDFHKTF